MECASSSPRAAPNVSPEGQRPLTSALKRSGDEESPAPVASGEDQGNCSKERSSRSRPAVKIKVPSPRFAQAPREKPVARVESTDESDYNAVDEGARPIEEQHPKTAALFVVLVSVVMVIIAVLQEKWGSGVEANSARKEGAPPISGVNSLWVIISSALVMIMTPAVALYYGGMVSEDKVLNRMVRTFVNLGLVGMQWLWIGYSLAFAPSNPYALNLVGDFSFVAMTGVGSSPAGSPAETYGVPHIVFVIFQLMFASITTTILSGAVANLMSFNAFCIFILAWTTFVYDPICHAVWGGGLLWWHLDFAGGLVIHVSSGVSAASAATYLYRLSQHAEAEASLDRVEVDLNPSTSEGEIEYLEEPNPTIKELAYYLFKPGYTKEHEMVWDRALGGATIAHNRTFVVLGAVLLWFGWFGFNGGSALAPNDVAAAALLNTNIAAGVAMITWMFCEAMCGGNPSAVGAATGAICGLVGITPCAGYIPTLTAVPVGAMSASCAFGFVWLDRHTRWLNWFSNPLDVMASHGVSGLVGSLLTGIFAFKPVNMDEPKLIENGLVYGGGFTMFLSSILAVVIVIVFSSFMTIFICIMLTKMLGVHGLLSAQDFSSQDESSPEEADDPEEEMDTDSPLASPKTQLQGLCSTLHPDLIRLSTTAVAAPQDLPMPGAVPGAVRSASVQIAGIGAVIPNVIPTVIPTETPSFNSSNPSFNSRTVNKDNRDRRQSRMRRQSLGN